VHRTKRKPSCVIRVVRARAVCTSSAFSVCGRGTRRVRCDDARAGERDEPDRQSWPLSTQPSRSHAWRSPSMISHHDDLRRSHHVRGVRLAPVAGIALAFIACGLGPDKAPAAPAPATVRPEPAPAQNASDVAAPNTPGNVEAPLAVPEQAVEPEKNPPATHVGERSGMRVSDVAAAQHTLSSSITSVDLRGLTDLELGFALLLVAGATGLALALGLVDRRHAFAILSALGARPNELGAFLWSEALLILLGGVAVGGALGVAVAAMLVKVLSGVFDPPPEALVIPWSYLAALVVAGTVSTGMAVLTSLRASRAGVIETLREM